MIKKKKPNIKLYVSLFIAFIMITSIFGFIISYQTGQEPLLEYNKFVFYQGSSGLYTKIGDNKVYFYYNPYELEGINLSKDIQNRILDSKVVSITYNPSSKYKKMLGGIQYEFGDIVYKALGIIVQRGLVDNKDYKLNKISCADATPFVPVILLEEGEEGVRMENNCIVVAAEDDHGFLKLYTRLLYGLLGVIE